MKSQYMTCAFTLGVELHVFNPFLLFLFLFLFLPITVIPNLETPYQT